MFANACATSEQAPVPGGDNRDWTRSQFQRAERLEEHLRLLSPPEEGETLRVLLAFDEAADLDLYVTDPLQETVYFANSPGRSGGRLVDDIRCEAAIVRVEEVRFAKPLSGRYRIGIDFPKRCDDSNLPRAQRRHGVYAIRVDRPGDDEVGRELFRRGIAAPGYFEVIAVEFEVGPRSHLNYVRCGIEIGPRDEPNSTECGRTNVNGEREPSHGIRAIED